MNNKDFNPQDIFILENNKIKGLTDYGKTLTEIIIPSNINGQEIGSIERSVFYKNNKITSIEIPNSVTSIGSSAFYKCDNLISVRFGENSKIRRIESYAFEKCSSLIDITIPNSVVYIGDCVFSGCESLMDITIPKSVKSIKYGLFSFCYCLTSIIIPNSILTIEKAAFRSCSSLTSAVFENNNNWIVCKNEQITKHVSNKSLVNKVIAAKYLRTTFCNWTWVKEK